MSDDPGAHAYGRSRFRIALVGCGRIAGVDARALRAVPRREMWHRFFFGELGRLGHALRHGMLREVIG